MQLRLCSPQLQEARRELHQKAEAPKAGHLRLEAVPLRLPQAARGHTQQAGGGRFVSGGEWASRGVQRTGGRARGLHKGSAQSQVQDSVAELCVDVDARSGHQETRHEAAVL